MLFLKLMLLYLIEIGMRLRRFVKHRFRHFCRQFQQPELVGEPVLQKAEEENSYYNGLCQELQESCESLEEQRKLVDEKIETYRELIRGWKKLLTGMDFTVRSSKSDRQMIENAVRFLVSAKRITILSHKDFEKSRKAVERYEETMRDFMDVLVDSGLVQLFPTDDLPRMAKINVPLFHISLLREEVFFLKMLLNPEAENSEYGSPFSWEELLAEYKATHEP